MFYQRAKLIQISLFSPGPIKVIAVLFSAVNVSAKGFRLRTITGEIAYMKDGAITLNDKKVFYSAMEIKIPDWTVVGAKAALSYEHVKGKDLYYDIVKPGGEFKVEEELERLYTEPK